MCRINQSKINTFGIFLALVLFLSGSPVCHAMNHMTSHSDSSAARVDSTDQHTALFGLKLGLIVQAVPTGLLETATILSVIDQAGGTLALPVIKLLWLTGAFGYPAWVGKGIEYNEQNAASLSKLSDRLPSFYLTGNFQYATFRTSNAPPALNFGGAIEYVYPLLNGVSLRTGFHWNWRRISVRNKTYYDPMSSDNEMVRVDVQGNAIEFTGPIELMISHRISSAHTIYGTIGYSYFLAGTGGTVKYKSQIPLVYPIDYGDYDEDFFLPPKENRMYLVSIGLMTTRMIWELQYTSDAPTSIRPVQRVGVDDQMYTLRFRLGYRLLLH